MAEEVGKSAKYNLLLNAVESVFIKTLTGQSLQKYVGPSNTL